MHIPLHRKKQYLQYIPNPDWPKRPDNHLVQQSQTRKFVPSTSPNNPKPHPQYPKAHRTKNHGNPPCARTCQNPRLRSISSVNDRSKYLGANSTASAPQLPGTPPTTTMGNICSRNDSDNFSQPGRVVGTNPPNAAPRASVPAKTNWKATPGRTLGQSDGTNAGADEARANAAIAAQVCVTCWMCGSMLMSVETRRGRAEGEIGV